MPGPIFIVREYGDMSNVLLTFINGAALAAENDRILFHLIFNRYAEYFAGTAHGGIVSYPPQAGLAYKALAHGLGVDRLRRLLFSEKWCRRLSPIVFAIDAPDNVEVHEDWSALQQVKSDQRAVVLKAWNLHLPTLVERHGEKLRAYFSLAPSWQKQLDEWWAAQTRPACLVGVHVRRAGPNYSEGGYFYRTDEFYHRRMIEMRTALGADTEFLICSDANVDLAQYRGLRVRRGPGHRMLDLYSLARCQWIFGPSSTYGEWASWFGQVPRAVVHEDLPLKTADFRVHRFA